MAKKKEKEKINVTVYVHGKNGEWVDMATLTQEQRDDIGRRAYQRMVRALGGVPVGEKRNGEPAI